MKVLPELAARAFVPVLQQANVRFVLLGKPGSGKGTQAKKLTEAHHLRSIATGELMRSAIAAQNGLGLQFQEYMHRGHLVPDDLVWALVSQALLQPNGDHCFMLDGFPRTVVQAKLLEDFLAAQGLPLSAVLYLDVPDNALVERAVGRRFCSHCGEIYHQYYAPPQQQGHCDQCGSKLLWRQDDQEQIVRARVVEYQEKTAPLLDFYRQCQLLFEVNGVGTPGEVFTRIQKVLPNRVHSTLTT